MIRGRHTEFSRIPRRTSPFLRTNAPRPEPKEAGA